MLQAFLATLFSFNPFELFLSLGLVKSVFKKAGIDLNVFAVIKFLLCCASLFVELALIIKNSGPDYHRLFTFIIWDS